MGSDPMVKKFFSHYAPRPLQQPQMPDMKQIKRSVCNRISHFSLLSYLPSAGNPSTQPPIRRLALPLIRSITVIRPTTPHNPISLFPAADNRHRQFLRSHRPHAAPSKYKPFLKVLLVSVLAGTSSSSVADALIHEDAPLIIFRLHVAIHKSLALFVQPRKPKLTIIFY